MARDEPFEVAMLLNVPPRERNLQEGDTHGAILGCEKGPTRPRETSPLPQEDANNAISVLSLV